MGNGQACQVTVEAAVCSSGRFWQSRRLFESLLKISFLSLIFNFDIGWGKKRIWILLFGAWDNIGSYLKIHISIQTLARLKSRENVWASTWPILLSRCCMMMWKMLHGIDWFCCVDLLKAVNAWVPSTFVVTIIYCYYHHDYHILKHKRKGKQK